MIIAHVIDIPKRNTHCFRGSETLESGMEYYSAIYEDAEGEFERRDFCTKCWKQRDTQKAFTYWKSKILTKEEKKVIPQDRDSQAFELLRDAMQEGKDEEAFILSLYLARRRIIALRQEVDGIQLYEVLATEEMLPIKKIELSTLKVEQLQLELAAKFKPVPS